MALKSFFLDILQNNMRFNTWHFARRIEAAVPPPEGEVRYKAIGDGGALEGDRSIRSLAPNAFYVPATATGISVIAMWDPQFGQLQLNLEPVAEPDRAFPRHRRLSRVGTGVVRIDRALPADERRNVRQPWQVSMRVEQNLAGLDHIPVTIAVLIDHDHFSPTVRFEASTTAPADPDADAHAAEGAAGSIDGGGRFCPRRPITVTAELKAFAAPVTNFRGRIVARAQARTTTEANSAREADCPVEFDAPGDDPASPRNIYLGNCYARSDAMRHRGLHAWHAPVELNDDGLDGDERAGDGVYSARIEPQHAGEHRFVVMIEGQVPKVGPVSVHEVEHIHVEQCLRRPTDAEWGIAPDGPTFRLSYTPHDTGSGLIGPGYDYHYWVSQPNLRDELDWLRPLRSQSSDGLYSGSIWATADRRPASGQLLAIKRPLSLAIEQFQDPAGGAPPDAYHIARDIVTRCLEERARGRVCDEVMILTSFGPDYPVADSDGCDCGVAAVDNRDAAPSGLLLLTILLGRPRRQPRGPAQTTPRAFARLTLARSATDRRDR